jgi:hypothetical protein
MTFKIMIEVAMDVISEGASGGEKNTNVEPLPLLGSEVCLISVLFCSLNFACSCIFMFLIYYPTAVCVLHGEGRRSSGR